MRTLPLKRFAVCRDDLREPVNATERAEMQGGIPYWGANQIQDYVNRFLVDGPTVLLGEDGAPFFDRTKSVAFFVNEPIWPNNHIHVLKALPHVDPRWLAYALNSVDYSRWISGSTRDKLTQEDMMSIQLPIMPLSNQQRIADYLDRETATIDTLIEKQQALLMSLRHRRIASIFEAVTRGLDGADVDPMPKSWAGVLPKNWTYTRLRRVAQMRTGHTPSRSEPKYWEDVSIPWFTLADVWQLRSGAIDVVEETNSKINRLGLENSAADLLPAGTVMLSRTASVGFAGIMGVPMATSQDYWNWVCGPDLEPRYLLQLFRAMRSEFDALRAGSTHQTIYKDQAAALTIPLPPLDEQRRIADHLDEETAKIDALIAKAERFIELAQERRAALITAAVTGQLSVD